MFWVVDNFLMKKHKTKAKLEEREEDSRGNSKVRYRRALSHDDSESEASLTVVMHQAYSVVPYYLVPSKQVLSL